MADGNDGSVLTLLDGFVREVVGADDPRPSEEPHLEDVVRQATAQPTCWFCRHPQEDTQATAAPGGQTLWRICRTCALEAVVAMILDHRLTITDVAGAYEQAVTERRAAATASARAATDTLEAAARDPRNTIPPPDGTG